ncbi:ribonuclease T [Methylonatrum kenyense]|uniref:ribonuclease T n=1 Tax=Methylonatrum kenyense TaxID=455253 RepID=UPI0020C05AA0|nr:ribonuclease T [Methylonatrum kenyense]MCK8517326.1 ribonuclease T [Methylonatrum kenyense]
MSKAGNDTSVESTTAATGGSPIASRFRSFLPVVVDVETGGLNWNTDALLQVAAVILRMDDQGRMYPAETHSCHVQPFEGANIDPKSLQINGIDPHHPLRIAYSEQDALGRIFKPIRQEIRDTGCTRAILVGHNATFDLYFMNAAVERAGIRRNPFHPFGSFDTATLGGLAYGQTVLARAVKASGAEWHGTEAHSAIYDAEKTADLFCNIVNAWDEKIGIPGAR